MTEHTILETNARGALEIPAGILGTGPNARFRLEHEGRILRLIRDDQARWETLSREDRVSQFRDWVARLPKRRGSAIPSEALRRENLYE
jgi:hypothetical protein